MSSICFNEPMKEHTSFKVGGAAELFAEPKSVEELRTAVMFFNKYRIPYQVIGNGTNLLVSDQGIDGAVVKIGDHFGEISFHGTTVIGGSGMLLSSFVRQCAKRGLTGMEFAGGIPGSLGGAIAMNAGAYGGEMKDVVQWVEVLDGIEVRRLENEALHFAYRRSLIESKGLIVLRVCVELRMGVQEEIDAKMAELAIRRKTKQPLHLPSAGSTFKRPEGHYASKLIEDAGLKGYTVGGAQVSELHAGFVVNVDHATAADIYQLIQDVQRIVFEKFGVRLEPEVKLLGSFA